MTRTPGWTRVADGVYRLSRAQTNCYLIVSEDGMTLVDAGLPSSWRPLVDLLGTLGATPNDIDALLLTHGHFDHVGMAARLHERHRVPALVHERDRFLAKHPYRYRHEAARPPYLVRYPRALPVLLGMGARGAFWVKGVDAAPSLTHGHIVDVPGTPTALWTPGHTDGHCGFYFAEADVLISGDAIVTLDPYTGRTGPRIVANAATADSATALDSLDVFTATGAGTMLPGHGEPWRQGIDAAVQSARRVGPS